MRLWHKNLLDKIPNAQLKGQWNEISAIIGAIKLHGSPRHGLVNYIMDYDYTHFQKYCHMVLNEINKRNDQLKMRYQPKKSLDKISAFFKEYNWSGLNPSNLFDNHHTDEYYEICIYNLKEKYLAKLISQEEWDIIIK